MKVRSRFLFLFAAQALVAALASVIFSFGAIAGEGARAEAEIGTGAAAGGAAAARAFSRSLPEAERLAAAIDYAETLRAQLAVSRVYRSQAAIEAAVKIGAFSLLWAAAAALAFAFASHGFTRRLDELASGFARVAGDRDFRFPALADREFAPVYRAVDDMLERLQEQERILGEAAKLEGWKEVSSFLFHQLRTPLSSIELAARNIHHFSGRPRTEAGEADEPAGEEQRALTALEACGESAASALAECERIRALLERFKNLAGLALAAPLPIDTAELVAALGSRIAPERARLKFLGDRLAVLADRRMLEEALLNLVVNAAEACPRPPALVSFRVSIEAPFVLLEVGDDNGPVDRELFEGLARGRYSTKAEGTGLGLLFVRRVVALHGGSLELFAGGDGGFRARLRLPMAETAFSGAPRSGEGDSHAHSRP
ncbi:MAG TPA: ATP-binding protein [Rectinemataceae bacterium]|nr:ATP-binding protein [Rectinemataceae bacterium]